ncbi:MAG TPA: DUF1385 domain-containing protein [bacterium]|nr:DUF1385 domain-containing protein [bacterium]
MSRQSGEPLTFAVEEVERKTRLLPGGRTRLLIGGQAVIEGVMMRSPQWTSTAVRRPDGAIRAVTEPHASLLLHFRWLRVPVLRGCVALYESLTIGIKALLLSAGMASGEPASVGGRQVAATVSVGVGVALGLFFLLPAAVIRSLDVYFPTALASNLAEGALRVLILLGYIVGIGRLPNVARIFAYHGAEHKAVNTYEAGAPLRAETARGFSRFHVRCGTSFLLIVMIMAIVVFSFLGRPPLVLRLASRTAFLPLIAGLSYELIRLAARFSWFRPVVVPGLWLQRLTTREPDERQIEVALQALREVVEREDASPSSGPSPEAIS